MNFTTVTSSPQYNDKRKWAPKISQYKNVPCLNRLGIVRVLQVLNGFILCVEHFPAHLTLVVGDHLHRPVDCVDVGQQLDSQGQVFSLTQFYLVGLLPSRISVFYWLTTKTFVRSSWRLFIGPQRLAGHTWQCTRRATYDARLRPLKWFHVCAKKPFKGPSPRRISRRKVWEQLHPQWIVIDLRSKAKQ